MILSEDLTFSSRRQQKLGMCGFDPWAAVEPNETEGEDRDGAQEDCLRICAAAGDFWLRMNGAGRQFAGNIGGCSHESEHDLAVMVSDFLENGSGGTDSRCSSDSDSGFLDLNHLAEKILFHKHSVDQYESDLLTTVRTHILSISESNLHLFKAGPCNVSCIRHSLVKLLMLSGYDAAVCKSKWQGVGKVPGGDNEYIDVVTSCTSGSSQRIIIDIDFHSHFEIARAVESYDAILNSLPVVYVGSLTKLKHFLQIMVEAARCSLKQNSMPLPPWRSLAYLQAKWHSTYERQLCPSGWSNCDIALDHKQCIGHLRMLKASLYSEIETERLLKPIINESNNRRVKLERWSHPALRT